MHHSHSRPLEDPCMESWPYQNSPTSIVQADQQNVGSHSHLWGHASNFGAALPTPADSHKIRLVCSFRFFITNLTHAKAAHWGPVGVCTYGYSAPARAHNGQVPLRFVMARCGGQGCMQRRTETKAADGCPSGASPPRLQRVLVSDKMKLW